MKRFHGIWDNIEQLNIQIVSIPKHVETKKKKKVVKLFNDTVDKIFPNLANDLDV